MRIKLLEAHEIPELYRILMDPEIAWALTADPTVITEKNLASFLLKTEPGTLSRAYAIYEAGKLVGCFTLNNISHIKNSAFLGVIAVKKGAGNMIGYKAGKWAKKLCFEQLNLNRMYGHTWADNPRMDAFYKRQGATLEGIEREHCWKNGKYVDLKIWGILRREYDATS
jgi:[ribosomal protein S5]-alanine N-acetyltransferase